MRRRLLLIAVMLVVGLVGAGVGASTSISPAPQPQATCAPPPNTPCLSDQECAAYNALCDTVAGLCTCASTDMGRPGDLGSSFPDASGEDLATGGGGGGGTTGGSTNGAPPVVAGNSGPARSGCSYVPGSAR